MRTLFRYRDTGGPLNRTNALIKLLLMVAYCSAVSIASGREIGLPVYCALALIIAVWIARRIPFENLLHGGLFFLFLVLATGIGAYFSRASVSESGGASYALMRACAYLDIVLASMVFTDCTGPTELARALGNGRAGLVTGLALSMIPMVADCITLTLEARRARGERLLKHPVKSLIGLVTGVLSNLFEKVQTYADALISRCPEHLQ